MYSGGLRLLLVALATAVALVFGVTAGADVGSGSGPPTSIGTAGAAASVEKLATQAAIDILRRGGNAVDAAVAAAGVLGVTEPFSCGVGGGGFMVVRTAGGAVTTIDGRETAPAAMNPTSFWENSAALFLDPDGTPRDVGTVFTNPALAATYERIAQLGAKGFYRGAVADALVDTVQHPIVSSAANHVWRPGVMTMRDLHGYTAPERAPTHVNYRGLDVYSMGPPSSGGSTVGEALNILEGYDLSSMTREAALHYYLEASRYSFVDRNAYLADPAYFDVPLSGLLSDDYATTRRDLIGPTAANPPVVQPGNPYPYAK